MNQFKIIMMIFLLMSLAAAQTYQIDWYVIGSGGGTAESDNYQINGTIGQPVVGVTSSENFKIEAGFWVGGASGPGLYEYLPGDANMYNGQWEPQVIGGDVTYLVNYFRGVTTSQACRLDGFYCSADANGDCAVIGSDVTRLVNYFRGQTTIEYCPDYEPAWPPLPEEAPSGWPNCETPVLSSDSKGNPGTPR